MSSSSQPLCATGCGKVGLLRCSGCLTVWYCGVGCQKTSWPQHKEPCKEMASKAKAEAEQAAVSAKAVAAAAAAAAAADEKPTSPLIEYKCAAEGCGKRAPLRCIRCLGAHYCNKECQLKSWPAHKGPCKDAVTVRAGLPIDAIDKSIELCKILAEAGDARAQYNLGLCYDKGTGLAVNKLEAIKWYKLAAEAGEIDAQNNLGTCYSKGDGVAINKPEAFKWYKRSAEAGQVDALCNLGAFYFNGTGVAANKLEGFKWMKRAAEAGQVNAQFNVATCYENGAGIAVDMHEAIKWYKRASEAGFAPAKTSLDRFSK